MQVSEIEAKIAELQKMKEEAIKAEEEANKAKNLVEAREIIGRLVDDLRRLGEIGYVPPKIQEALTDSNGKYNPGLYVKRPKGSA